MTEKLVKCTNCYMELSGDDGVMVDVEGRPFCSEDCYLASNDDYNMMSAEEFIAMEEAMEENEEEEE